MSEQKLSERMQEVIDVYEETQWRVDPAWMQFRDGVASLEAKQEACLKREAVLLIFNGDIIQPPETGSGSQ